MFRLFPKKHYSMVNRILIKKGPDGIMHTCVKKQTNNNPPKTYCFSRRLGIKRNKMCKKTRRKRKKRRKKRRNNRRKRKRTRRRRRKKKKYSLFSI